MLFNKETFYPDIEVKSINLHDTRRELPDKAMEGDKGNKGEGEKRVEKESGIKIGKRSGKRFENFEKGV